MWVVCCRGVDQRSVNTLCHDRINRDLEVKLVYQVCVHRLPYLLVLRVHQPDGTALLVTPSHKMILSVMLVVQPLMVASNTNP